MCLVAWIHHSELSTCNTVLRSIDKVKRILVCVGFAFSRNVRLSNLLANQNSDAFLKFVRLLSYQLTALLTADYDTSIRLQSYSVSMLDICCKESIHYYSKHCYKHNVKASSDLIARVGLCHISIQSNQSTNQFIRLDGSI
jgi:hypothetical protein